VLTALAGLVHGMPEQDSALDQQRQPFGQRRPGDTEFGLHVAEAPCPADHLPQDQQRPGVSDFVDGARQGALIQRHLGIGALSDLSGGLSSGPLASTALLVLGAVLGSVQRDG